MKKYKRSIISMFVIALFAVSIFAVSAHAASYSFNIHTQVTGTTKHSLNNKSTTTSVTAGSYRDLTGSARPSGTLNYNVRLESTKLIGGENYTTSSISANNVAANRSFGTIAKDSYRVNVGIIKGTKDYIGYVRGSGTIKQ